MEKSHEKYKLGLYVKISDRYLYAEGGILSGATRYATIMSAPSDEEELVMVQYTDGSFDYIPQTEIEIINNEIMKITKDGFIWKVLSKQQAKTLWYTDTHELYVLHSCDSESLIESQKQFDDAIENDLYIGIEVGKIETEQCQQILETRGYFTRNLWSVDDVKAILDCTDDGACHSILHEVFTNDEYLIEQCSASIQTQGEKEGFNKL